jgi:predicted signal transduction protein with EAL and GGDEF domain
LREGDTVARLGGDEFAILLPGITHLADATEVAQRICKRLEWPFTCAGQELRTSASIGISLYPADGTDADTLLKNADLAMYQAKARGGGYQVHVPAMNGQVSHQLMVEVQLRQALEAGAFLLHYQPQVEAVTGRLVGVEALVRWRRANGELVSPADFIPIAETTGLIVPLGEWVLRTACLQGQHWHQQGFPLVRLAVNLSARQLDEDTVVDRIASILRDTGWPPACLELELTEGLLIRGDRSTLAKLEALRVMGVALSIDDFGTGYSSLASLKRVPISALKIDRSFVSACPDDPDQTVLVSTIVAMAHSLKLRVVAEGVETAAQWAFLQQIGCDEAQGYLFSKPCGAEEIGRLLASQRPWDHCVEGQPLLTRQREKRGRESFEREKRGRESFCQLCLLAIAPWPQGWRTEEREPAVFTLQDSLPPLIRGAGRSTGIFSRGGRDGPHHFEALNR